MLVAFDAGVNSGVTRSARWLQGALRVAADGRIGPVTLAAALAQPALPVIEAACRTRMSFLRGLRTFAAFGRGWTARVARVEARAMAMAVAAAGADPRPVLAARASLATAASSSCSGISPDARRIALRNQRMQPAAGQLDGQNDGKRLAKRGEEGGENGGKKGCCCHHVPRVENPVCPDRRDSGREKASVSPGAARCGQSSRTRAGPISSPSRQQRP